MLNPALKEKLLALEPQNPILKEKFEKEIKTMIEKPLTSVFRTSLIVTGIFGVVNALFIMYLLFTLFSELPLVANSMLAIGAIGSLCWSFVAYKTLKRGVLNLKRDPALFNGIIWIVVVLGMTGYLYLGMDMKDAAQGSRMILFGMVFFDHGCGIYGANHDRKNGIESEGKSVTVGIANSRVAGEN